MQLTLYTAACTGNAKNCLYPNQHTIMNSDDFKAVIRKDHVCAAYDNNYRSAKHFIAADCLVMDCDNDHSDTPADWATPDTIFSTFPEVACVISYSRNHMKIKNGKAARPKFHVYFPITEITDPDSCMWLCGCKGGNL